MDTKDVEENSKTVLSAKEKSALVIEHRLVARQLAKSLLKKWRVYCDGDELGSIVDVSLCEAADRFDPKHGTKFSTWLYYFLKGYLIREVVISGCSKDAPIAILPEQTPHDSTMGQIHHGDTRELQLHHELSYDTPALGYFYGVRPDEVLYIKQLLLLSGQAIQKLQGTEQEVVHKIYVEGRSISETSRELGYSRGHISRLHAKALKKLKGYVSRRRFETLSPSDGNSKSLRV